MLQSNPCTVFSRVLAGCSRLQQMLGLLKHPPRLFVRDGHKTYGQVQWSDAGEMEWPLTGDLSNMASAVHACTANTGGVALSGHAAMRVVDEDFRPIPAKEVGPHETAYIESSFTPTRRMSGSDGWASAAMTPDDEVRAEASGLLVL